MLRVARFKNHDFMSAWFGKLNNSCVISRESCFSCKRKKIESHLQVENKWRKYFQNNFVVTDRLVGSYVVGSTLDLALQHVEIGKLEKNSLSLESV